MTRGAIPSRLKIMPGASVLKGLEWHTMAPITLCGTAADNRMIPETSEDTTTTSRLGGPSSLRNPKVGPE